jgi:hypothetical protein
MQFLTELAIELTVFSCKILFIRFFTMFRNMTIFTTIKKSGNLIK